MLPGPLSDMSISDNSVHHFCRSVLESGTLEAKLKPPVAAGGGLLRDDEPGPALRVDQPARAPELRPHRVVDPLPPRGRVATVRDQVACLRRFAHHELMAVELFAWALLAFPDAAPEFRRGLVRILADEQRHTRMYLKLLSRRSAAFGDFPVSGYFWAKAGEWRGNRTGTPQGGAWAWRRRKETRRERRRRRPSASGPGFRIDREGLFGKL